MRLFSGFIAVLAISLRVSSFAFFGLLFAEQLFFKLLRQFVVLFTYSTHVKRLQRL